MPAACTVMTYHGSRAEPNKHRAPAHKTVRGKQARTLTLHVPRHMYILKISHRSTARKIHHWFPQSPKELIGKVRTISPQCSQTQSCSEAGVVPRLHFWHPFSNFHKFTASASYKRKATLQIKSRLTRPHLFMRPAQWRLQLFPREEAHFSASTYKLSIKLYSFLCLLSVMMCSLRAVANPAYSMNEQTS